jgi:hypothetical protein
MAAARLKVVEAADEPVVIDQEVIMPDDVRWPMACQVQEMEINLRAVERDLRTKRRQITALQRDEERRRKAYERRPAIEALFSYWQSVARHPKSLLTADRFDAAMARLEDGYTEEQIRRALDGIAFEPNRKPLANGRWECYDDMEIALRSGKNLERYANRAPVPKRKLLRIRAVGFTTRVLAEDGRIVSAPFLPYSVGWDGSRFMALLKRKGWEWTSIEGCRT